MKEIIKKWLLSFDYKDETGFDYKKLTSFWGVIACSWLIFCYCVESVDLYWLGVTLKIKNDLPEFKWILGLVLAFIITLSYFTNSSDLSKFILKFKNNGDKKKDNSDPDAL